MENFMNLIASNGMAVGAGAMMCGVALFYLVMQRTIKHRKEEAGTDSQ